MAWSFHGTCYTDAVILKNAVDGQLPFYEFSFNTSQSNATPSPQLIYLNSSTFNATTGLYSFTLKDTFTPATTFVSQSFTLPTCTPDYGFGDYSVSTIVFFVAVFVAFALGFQTSFRP